MELSKAINSIHSPKGVTTFIDALTNGDFGPIDAQNATGIGIVEAKQKLEGYLDAQRNCKSDAAYWGYMGDISYWRAVVDILEASEITGPESLPDINPPDLLGCAVMDACSRVEKFGKAILEAAKEQQ